MEYLYYPGCSLKGTGNLYEKSVLATFDALGITLTELPDWNCCGATNYMSIDEKAAFTMAARNIAIAEREESDIIAPCSACYMVLRKTQRYSREYPHIRQAIRKSLERGGLSYTGQPVQIRHPLDVIVNEIGLEQIKKSLKKKLNGLRIFPYYGCLIVRPQNGFDHPVYPTSMDRLLESLGCEVIEHPLKTKCCGGSLTGTIEDVGLRLVYILLREAKKKGAHAISTVCPLCQFNLEAYQSKTEKAYAVKFDMPVLYFTQLLGYALGIDPKLLGISQLIVPADNILSMVS